MNADQIQKFSRNIFIIFINNFFMQVTRQQSVLIFALGTVLQSLRSRVRPPLSISLSKSAFIDIVLKTRIIGVKDRELYRLLEVLEDKKLLQYDGLSLLFSSRGEKVFSKIVKTVGPFLNVQNSLAGKIPSSGKARTVLSV